MIGYENLVMEGASGILKGKVGLILEMDGEQTVGEDVWLMFAERNGDWELQHLKELEADEVGVREQALSG